MTSQDRYVPPPAGLDTRVSLPRLGAGVASAISGFAATIMIGTILASIAYYVITRRHGPWIAGGRPWSTALMTLAFILSGAAVARRLPANPLGWLLLGI